MTRPWGKLHASMLTSPKFIRSTPEERGAWVTVLLYAFNSPTDDELGTEGDIVAILHREGFADPEAMLRRLVQLHWIDRRARHYVVHDWADWQPDDPTGAKRKRALRTGSVGTRRSHDVPGTVTGPSADIPRTVTGRSSPRGEENREERILPLSPSMNGQRTSRWNGRASFDDLLEGDDVAGTGAMLMAAAPHADPRAETQPATEGELR